MIREIPWRVHQESEKERKKREDRVSEKGIRNGGEQITRGSECLWMEEDSDNKRERQIERKETNTQTEKAKEERGNKHGRNTQTQNERKIIVFVLLFFLRQKVKKKKKKTQERTRETRRKSIFIQYLRKKMKETRVCGLSRCLQCIYINTSVHIVNTDYCVHVTITAVSFYFILLFIIHFII